MTPDTPRRRIRQKRAVPPNLETAPAPIDSLDTSDPGDQTQRNFRYQHAYGVILIVQSRKGVLPYIAILCEQHEDFLGIRIDGDVDGWQIKTRAVHSGRWKLTDDEFVHCISRFVNLVAKY